jgi:hypothetical protein
MERAAVYWLSAWRVLGLIVCLIKGRMMIELALLAVRRPVKGSEPRTWQVLTPYLSGRKAVPNRDLPRT